MEAHPEFSREQEEIERLDGKDRLSEAVGRLGTHAPEGAGVVNHGALGGGGAEEEWSEEEEEEGYDVSELVGRLRANDESGLVARDLGASDVGDHGGRAIGEGLGHNTTLTQLNLENTLVGDAVGRAIRASWGARPGWLHV